MNTRGMPARAAVLVLVAGVLAGCAGKRIAPYAWAESEDDPRLSVRVAVDTPDAEPVPTRELVHPNGRAKRPGDVEWPDPRLACCPEDAEKEAFKRNEVAIFLGYTGVRAGDGGTVGIGYHRRLGPDFGIAAFGEYVFGESQVPVVGAGMFFQPIEKVNILLAGGVEFEHGGEAEPLFRIGGFYRIRKVAGTDVSPAIYLDIVRNKDPVIIIGFELGREW